MVVYIDGMLVNSKSLGGEQWVSTWKEEESALLVYLYYYASYHVVVCAGTGCWRTLREPQW